MGVVLSYLVGDGRHPITLCRLIANECSSAVCADPQIVDRVRDVVQRRGGAKVRLTCLDFGPESARRPGLCLA